MLSFLYCFFYEPGSNSQIKLSHIRVIATMEPRIALTMLSLKPCVSALNLTQPSLSKQICPRPGWPYELSIFLVNLLSVANKMVISQSGRLNVIRAVGYTANFNLSAQSDLSIMRELYENVADLSPPYMILSESRNELVTHLGALIPIEPVVFFRKEIVRQFNFSLLQMFSYPYLAMFLLPFIGSWIILRMGFRTQAPRQFKVSNIRVFYHCVVKNLSISLLIKVLDMSLLLSYVFCCMASQPG